MVPKLLIIPDAHAEPNYDNDRLTWLGNLIFEEKPDVVVCLGDWFDMASLSSHDKGKKSVPPGLIASPELEALMRNRYQSLQDDYRPYDSGEAIKPGGTD